MYHNPIKRHGDFADPFVMRWNGIYYLYATNPDIRCWTSPDLLHWRKQGATITYDTFPGLVPFAPEVIYQNGKFYMYTSPSGYGHYVLESDNPKGPFHKLSGNFGHSIDGSVFVDDDGTSYFYWASDEGIMGCIMEGPDRFGEPVNTGAYLHGWTEGPMVIKEEGLYYLTYTGNHYLSPGYRINAAVSRSPLGPYTDCPNNPTLLHTTGKHIGLGHSSTVIGPDLSTYYIIYHNLNPDKTRDLNIDAIEIKNGKIQVAGNVSAASPKPMLPCLKYGPRIQSIRESWEILNGERQDVRYHGETFLKITGENISCRTKDNLPQAGSFEIWLAPLGGRYEVLWKGCTLTVDLKKGKVILKGTGAEIVECDFMVDQNHTDAIRSLLISYESSGIQKLKLDGRANISDIDLKKIQTLPGPTALSIEAEHGIILGCFSASDVAKDMAGIYYSLPCRMLVQNHVCVNVPEHGKWLLGVLSSAEENLLMTEECTGLLTYCRDEAMDTAKFLKRNSDMMLYQLYLPKGLHTLQFYSVGSFWKNAQYFFCQKATNYPIVQSFGFDLKETVEKYTFEMDECMETDVSIICSKPFNENEGELGLLFRASELAKGGEGDDETLGYNFMIGYCVTIRDGNIFLSKHRYDENILASSPIKRASKCIYVKSELNDIYVYVDGEILLTYHDRDPILWGKVGIRHKGVNLQGVRVEIKGTPLY